MPCAPEIFAHWWAPELPPVIQLQGNGAQLALAAQERTVLWGRKNTETDRGP